MDQPFVSVIIPAYNGEVFLAEAIRSIQQQNYSPLEIIIVDDGSTDGTAQVAAIFKDQVRYVYQPNSGGPAAGRNRGMKMARGELICFLDQDDLWSANKLSIQVPRMVEDPSLEVVLGRVQMMRLVRVVNGKYEFEELSDPLIRMLLSSGLFRKSIFDRVGFFKDASGYANDDLDWFMRARELEVSMLILKEVTLFWRLHGQNKSLDKTVRDYEQGYDRGLIQVLKQSLNRRRNQPKGPARQVPWFTDFCELKIKPPNDAS